MSDSVREINALLIDYYGLDIDTGLPKYRLVWTTSQFEKRYEEFNVFSESGAIFLREEKGVFEVPKYPDEWKDMWVLERLQPTDGNPYLYMVAKYSYEPLWVFGCANSSPQPNWRAVQLLVRNSLYGDPNARTKSPQDLEREFEEKLANEKKLVKEMLAEDTSGLAFPLKHGMAAFIDSTKRFGDSKNDDSGN